VEIKAQIFLILAVDDVSYPFTIVDLELMGRRQ
jgi:hypothetical protein